MPVDWVTHDLGTLGELRNGVNFSREQEGVGLSVLKVKDFGDLVLSPLDGLDELDPNAFRVPPDQLLQDGDIVIIRSNGNPELVGRSVVVRGVQRPTTFSGFCIRFRPDKRTVDPRFAAYFLRSPIARGRMTRFGSGTGIQNLNQGILSALPIDLPALREQQVIADVLVALDDKIEHNRRTARALEALARATFKAWFVDFEPVKAKAAGAAGFPGMPAAALAALPDRMTDSTLGPVPDGWAIKSLCEVTTLSKQQIMPQDYPDEFFDHFSLPAYDAGQNPVVEPGSRILSQKFLVVPGCVLLSKLNPRIPRIWIPTPANGRRQIASTEFLVAVPKPGWTREFLYYLFQQDEFRDSLAQSASGTSNSHQRVRPSDLLARPMVEPPKAALDAFADQVVPQIELLEALHTESSKLKALRDYLLPQLLSGRVRVESAAGDGR